MRLFLQKFSFPMENYTFETNCKYTERWSDATANKRSNERTNK